MDDRILKTERLILRYQRRSDIEFLVALWMDEEMTKYTGGPREKSFLMDEFTKVAESPQELEFDLWTIELKDTHELIGQAGFIPKEIKGREHIELNYYIEKSRWKKGYGKEIATGLLEYGLMQKKLDRIIAMIDPENEASKRLAESIGMRFWVEEERSGKVKRIYRIEHEKLKHPD